MHSCWREPGAVDTSRGGRTEIVAGTMTVIGATGKTKAEAETKIKTYR
jgi:hypothetical protein